MLIVHVFWRKKNTCLRRCRSKPNRNTSVCILLCVLVSETISPVLLFREKHACNETDMSLECMFCFTILYFMHSFHLWAHNVWAGKFVTWILNEVIPLCIDSIYSLY